MQGFDILLPTVLLLATGFVVILLARVMKISPVVGFIIAGLFLGPYGLGLIQDTHATHVLAELGVVFLLFDIGLHFSMKSAWSLRRDLFGLAPLQVLLCALILGFSMSFVFGVSAPLAMLCGLALALSSTAVVMQILADLKQTESPVGSSAKAVLIFQDLAAIFLLIFADSIGADIDLTIAIPLTLGKTVLAFFAALILGQYILTPLLRAMTRYNDPEMFTVLGLLIVMMTGLATASAGLSLALGAFLAGMVLAETPFRTLLQTELRPFRGLLMALFFISIGMIVNPVDIANNILTVLALAVLLIAAKGAIIGALVYILGNPLHRVIQLIFMLAQGSEFALVVFAMPPVQNALGFALTEQLIAAVAISMLTAPFLGLVGYRWSLRVAGRFSGRISNDPSEDKSMAQSSPVFIIGMNEVGKTLARAMKAHKIPYIGVDHDHDRFLKATAAGYIVTYGQSYDLRFWDTLGVREARAMCIATPRYEVAKAISPVVRKIYPTLKRYVAVKDSADGVRFATLGLKPFHCYGVPPGLEMACFILKEFGIDEERITAWRDDEQSAFLEVSKVATPPPEKRRELKTTDGEI